MSASFRRDIAPVARSAWRRRGGARAIGAARGRARDRRGARTGARSARRADGRAIGAARGRARDAVARAASPRPRIRHAENLLASRPGRWPLVCDPPLLIDPRRGEPVDRGERGRAAGHKDSPSPALD
ncbi:hypothetical protein [Sorangium cellulosum]|uniref:hypothetical protein n=1 Tax=Sorangium cellulosum TaxID=56 RepID=UPI0010111A2E|nr:hypothetical protein [Sorangium cellulosum]